MKKLFPMVLSTICLFTVSQATAQVENPTTQTATKKMGYKVMNPGQQITIYKYVHAAHSPKETEKYAPKYFFATKSSDALQELTKENLKKAFPDNHAFHDALDENFKEDKDLIKYDSFHKMYKISHIYQTTIK
ncbi:MAG: hypothetical protein ABIU77_20100 [Ferruginibacter sp.]|jgi:hypothetical protein